MIDKFQSFLFLTILCANLLFPSISLFAATSSLNQIMFMLHHSASLFQLPCTSHETFLSISPQSHSFFQPKKSSCSIKITMNCQRVKNRTLLSSFDEEHNDDDDDDYIDVEIGEEADGVGGSRGFIGKEGEKNYDKDPELAEILGSCLDDPNKAQSRMEERLRKKRNKIVHTKTGSPTPMNVKFDKFEFTNSYIWFEFYNAPLEKDISLICDTIRSWHIVGRLGGCNSLNMQLSQSLMDKRPSYDVVQGANVTPTTFYNIGDFEIQDNLARLWVDIGTSENLLLDILINALTQISTDYVGIKQVVFGGSEFENWKENLTSEDAGYSVHKI